MPNRSRMLLMSMIVLLAPLLLSCGAPAEPQAEEDSKESQEPSPGRLIGRAEAAFRAGDGKRALKLADRAVELEPENYRWRQRRGSLRFRLGKVAPAVEDFDRAVELEPPLEPYNWQRGIALYYAGRHADGREQFERHRTVNPNDVENAAWHFLCVARQADAEAARRALLPVGDDPRVPMKVVYRMFAGEADPDAVLEAAEADDPPPGRRQRRLFYAHLYVGLYLDATGQPEKALNYIRLAAEKHGGSHYMADVARVHRDHLLKTLGQSDNNSANGDSPANVREGP